MHAAVICFYEGTEGQVHLTIVFRQASLQFQVKLLSRWQIGGSSISLRPMLQLRSRLTCCAVCCHDTLQSGCTDPATTEQQALLYHLREGRRRQIQMAACSKRFIDVLRPLRHGCADPGGQVAPPGNNTHASTANPQTPPGEAAIQACWAETAMYQSHDAVQGMRQVIDGPDTPAGASGRCTTRAHTLRWRPARPNQPLEKVV